MSETTEPIGEMTPDHEARNRGVAEALLIASDDPLNAGRIASVLSGVEAREVRRYIDELNAEYANTGRSFSITEVAGGYQFKVHAEYGAWVRRLLREKAPARLSQAALETLSIVAFKQPITKAEVEQIRGVSADGVLRHLLEKTLVRISGRAEGPGRPLLYGTTRGFLKHFGLKTLSDLPKLREMDELMRHGEESELGDSIGDLFAAAGDASLQEEDGTDGEAGTPEPVLGQSGSGLEKGGGSADFVGPDPG